ncbi:MAG: LytTR family transcriptional regulator DNA-binding domain-containing protein [Rhizobiaceae bacterium]
MESNQPDYADSPENFANPTPMQITLRVMHAIYTNPKYWIGFMAVIAMLTIMGPFGTLQDLEFAPRLVYWATVSLVTFPIGMACSMFFGITTHQRGVPEGLSRALGGVAGGLPIGLIVFLVNRYMLPTDIATFGDLVRLTGYTTVISAGVSIIYYLIETGMSPEGAVARIGATQTAPNPVQANQPARFFQRLPVALGRDLISLQAQDHYVRAVTARGSEMILIRLADAEAELDGLPGLRVHRSWWVADRHMHALERRNSKHVLVLDNGIEIPVSRTFLADVRAHMQAR